MIFNCLYGNMVLDKENEKLTIPETKKIFKISDSEAQKWRLLFMEYDRDHDELIGKIAVLNILDKLYGDKSKAETKKLEQYWRVYKTEKEGINYVSYLKVNASQFLSL